MAQKRGFNFSLSRHYDKAIAVVVLIALLVSLFVLARSAAESREKKHTYEAGVANMRPKYPVLVPQATVLYEMALRSLHSPETVRASTNDVGLFIPEHRVWCVDCLYPILFTATECPFCHAQQPAETTTNAEQDVDSEGKGIPDWWRLKYFKHKFAMAEDHSRADDDADSDGFTNLQEFKAEMNPLDPKDHPELVTLLRFKEITSRPFPFVLTSASKMSDGNLNLAFLMRSPEAGRTYYVKKGDSIGKTGLIYSNCVQKTERVLDPKMGNIPRNVDRYEATVHRSADGKTFVLKDNDAHAAMEQEIVLTLTAGEKVTEYRVSTGGVLELDGQKYKVALNLGVDDKPVSVVLENLLTGRKSTISTGS